MKTKTIIALFWLFALAFSSCSKEAAAVNSGETGRLTVRLTDAPFPYDLVTEANVTIFKVEARQHTEGDTDEMGEEMESESPFVVLM